MEYERFQFRQPLYGDVNVLRVGDTLIDTGHVASTSRDAVAGALADGLAGVERVVLTHPHVDHVGGSETIPELAELPHSVPTGVPDLLSDYEGYLREARADMTRLLSGVEGHEESNFDRYFPLDVDYIEEGIAVERVLADGDTVCIGEYECEAVHTPGHSAQHLAFWHDPSGTLLSGDLVSRNGHFQYGPLYGDIGAYKASLRRVRALDPDLLVPMHGPPMTDPRRRVSDCLDKALATERKLVGRLDEAGPFHAREFVETVLGADGFVVPFLTLVVYEYARHLAERGKLSVTATDEGIRIAPPRRHSS